MIKYFYILKETQQMLMLETSRKLQFLYIHQNTNRSEKFRPEKTKT